MRTWDRKVSQHSSHRDTEQRELIAFRQLLKGRAELLGEVELLWKQIEYNLHCRKHEEPVPTSWERSGRDDQAPGCQGVCIGKRGRSSICEGTLEEVAGNRYLGTKQRRRPGMPDVVRFFCPVLGPLPPASHRSGVLRCFPILTSVSDDLSAREARASEGGGEGGGAAGEHAPIRQPRPMGASCGSPPPRAV